MLDILSNGVVRIVLLGTLSLGIVSGVLGVFTLLRKQALIGDALSHATLPGVVIMFIFTNSKDIGVLIVGAAISAGVAMFLMRLIKQFTILENDAILALILSSFFGFGRFLISLISRNPEFSQAKLDDFIFGSAATIIERDVSTLLIVSIIVFILILLFWRHLKTQTFNPEFYESLGFSNTIIEFMVSFMTILVIVSGIRSVGVILMSALLILPGIATRQWSDRLGINVVLAGIFGGISAFIGTLISVSVKNGLPTGPVIVIVGTAIAIFSILFAPKRGLISKEIQKKHHQKQIVNYRNLINYAHSHDRHLLQNSYYEEQLVDIKTKRITEKGYAMIEGIMKGVS